MKNNALTRQELYDLVWNQPISKLAEQFKIEPKRLKEICTENEIPLPNRGYWSKIRFNTKIVKTPLPKIENSNSLINLRTRKFRTDYHKRAFELEQRKDLKFKVPGRISTYHPLVKATKKLLENIDNSKERFKFWEVSQEHDLLPIQTDSKLRSRGLRFMNTLIRVVEAMGHKITFEYSRCHVEMFGQIAEINLRQKVYRIRKKDSRGWGTETWEKSEKLEFQVGPSFNQKSWIDKKTIRLEEYLPEIIAWIEKDCKYWHDLRAEQAIEENKRVLAQQKLDALKEKQEQEQAKVEQLITNSKNWNKSQILENYINEMEKQAVLDNELNIKMKEYIVWSRKVASSINPLIDKDWLK